MLYEVKLNGVSRGQFQADDCSEAIRLARIGFSDDVRTQEVVEVPAVDPIEVAKLEGDGTVDPVADLESSPSTDPEVAKPAEGGSVAIPPAGELNPT
jgi:hypothetical protein